MKKKPQLLSVYGCHITAPHSSIVINPEHAIQSKYILNYTCANHDKQKKQNKDGVSV